MVEGLVIVKKFLRFMIDNNGVNIIFCSFGISLGFDGSRLKMYNNEYFEVLDLKSFE